MRERLVGFVRRKHDRQPACAQPVELAQHPYAVAEVEVCRWLVQQDDRRLLRKRTRYHDELSLAAHYVAKVLKGAKPGDLPVEQPNRYFLVINLRTAKNLGLSMPQSLLLRADEVIQ